VKLSALSGSFVVLLASACAKLPPTHYYLLEVPPSRAAETGSAELLIGVELFEVAAPYDQRAIAYRPAENTPEIGFYSYHQWAAPLQVMLQRAAVETLSGAASGVQVERAAPGEDYEARLAGHLLVLEEVGIAPELQRVDLALELELTDAGGRELWSGRRVRSGEVSAENVVEIVGAMNDLLASTLAELRDELVASTALP
jgi:hypothetical protein